MLSTTWARNVSKFRIYLRNGHNISNLVHTSSTLRFWLVSNSDFYEDVSTTVLSSRLLANINQLEIPRVQGILEILGGM